ncbi:hypothetical protein T03_1210 [Trichinella britovi]|uniref:Uncharacterized protein n=1 Tax=Trichinella britovi TaxID=45882 RepID=A0A0V0YYD6_TRIBR|nr:hypothetical protein T03_1210 [Trichinella britovi]
MENNLGLNTWNKWLLKLAHCLQQLWYFGEGVIHNLMLRSIFLVF